MVPFLVSLSTDSDELTLAYIPGGFGLLFGYIRKGRYTFSQSNVFFLVRGIASLSCISALSYAPSKFSSCDGVSLFDRKFVVFLRWVE